MQSATLSVDGGLIVYDAAQRGKVTEQVFVTSYWRVYDALSEPLGGRGAAWRIRHDGIDWVLRFYRRGGLPGKFIDDRYFFTGMEKTRPWREWHLLARMHELGLPVPHPVAARILQRGLSYRGAIITETLPGSSLAFLLANGDVPESAWRATGECIRRFHDAGVWHADLNAHNVLVDAATGAKPRVSLIDFDRGRMRAQSPAWRQANLDRLRRSLLKLAAGRRDDTPGWKALTAAYRGE